MKTSINNNTLVVSELLGKRLHVFTQTAAKPTDRDGNLMYNNPNKYNFFAFEEVDNYQEEVEPCDDADCPKCKLPHGSKPCGIYTVCDICEKVELNFHDNCCEACCVKYPGLLETCACGSNDKVAGGLCEACAILEGWTVA